MQCPHCKIAFNASHESCLSDEQYIAGDVEGEWGIRHVKCPTCEKVTLILVQYTMQSLGGPKVRFEASSRMIRPMGAVRHCPKEVPAPIAADFKEASEVLAISAKAAAALGRRCLQTLIRTAVGIKKGSLDQEIQALLDTKTLPSHLADDVDAVRHLGNFATHPIKSTNTGELVEVEPQEAEWTLDVLEGLFDFYYVQPAVARGRRDALNNKLKDAKKPPLKSA